jgi:hypothetical protein
MLNLDRSQMIEGLMVYRDDDQINLFYVIPDQPRFRIDDVTKKPVFSFIKYKMPVDRPDGSKGGGFVIFDSSLTVPADKMAKIQDALDGQLQAQGVKGGDGQPLKAKIGQITYTSGTATLTLLDSGGALVSKIESVGKPSLYGSLICSFTAELSPEGAAVLEAVMQKSGGVAQIAYDMHCSATLPPITGRVWFYASKFYSFYQSIDKSGGSWDSSNDRETDTLRESFMSSQAGGVYFDFSHLNIADPQAAQKTQDAITNWGWAQIDDAVKTAILPDIKAADDRGDHGMDHITKMQSTWESSSFNRYFSEKQAVDFHLIPQGTLPNIVDMGFQWKDFCTEVNADDPFFRQIHTTVAVNADFQKFQINSVDVHCEYTKSNPATVGDFHFTKPDDLGKFDSNTADGDMNYAYSFEVNYTDQPLPYKAPLVPTNKGHITINANDLGILYVGLQIGSVDFAKTPQVQVAVRYPGNDANGRPVSSQFNFASDKKADAMVAVLLKPVDQPYEYQITYIMADGTQVITDWAKSDSEQLYINSPFVMHTYSFLAEGDFASNIDNIFLKWTYTDPVNKVTQQGDFNFSAANQSHDWTIPVIASGKGMISYAGEITYKDHTKEQIPESSTDRDLIEFGPPNQVIISVLPDATLIDFNQVKMVKLDLEYKDDANKIDVKHEFLLKAGATPTPWTFYARDPSHTDYTYSATFYMATTPPTVVQAPPTTSHDTALVLMMPS